MLDEVEKEHGANTKNKLEKTIKSINEEIKGIQKKLDAEKKKLDDLPLVYNDKIQKDKDNLEKSIAKYEKDLEAAQQMLTPYTSMLEEYDSRTMEKQGVLNKADEALQSLDENMKLYSEAPQQETPDKEPTNKQEFVSTYLGSFAKAKNRLNRESLKAAFGWSDSDLEKFTNMISNEGGQTIDELSELIFAEAQEQYPSFFKDYDVVKSTIQEVMTEAGDTGKVDTYIKDRRGGVNEEQVRLDYEARQLGYEDAADMREKRLADAQQKLESLKGEDGFITEKGLKEFQDYVEGLKIKEAQQEVEQTTDFGEMPNPEDVDVPFSFSDKTSEEIAKEFQDRFDAVVKNEKSAESKGDLAAAKVYDMQKARVVRDYLKTIADVPYTVLEDGSLETQLASNGVSPRGIEHIRRTDEYAKSIGASFKGFNIKGRVYIVLDFINSIEDARTAYVHERQHTYNVTIDKKFVSLCADNASSEELLGYLQNMAGTDFYDKYADDHDVLADEFVAHAMELAYKVDDIETALKENGVDNEVLIETIKKLDYEQRTRSNIASKARRGRRTNYSVSHNEERGGGQNDGNLQGKSERVEVQGSRSVPRSSGETESGRVNNIPPDQQTPKNTTIDDVLYSIKVNHNSPYLLKKADGSFIDPETGERLGFDHRFMNTGEGGQAHGWGSYFSVNDLRRYGYQTLLGFVKHNYPKDVYDAIYPIAMKSFDALDLLDKLVNGQNKNEELAEIVKEYMNSAQHHYDVEIPDNNGENYIEEGERPSDEMLDRIIAGLEEKGVPAELADSIKKGMHYKTNRNGKYVYNRIADMILPTANNFKQASKFLHDIGFTGIHYDGIQDGECYVIFDENDAKITDHVRFSVSGKNNIEDNEENSIFVPANDVPDNRYEQEESSLRFSIVSDPKEIERLDKEPKEIGYRNVVLNENGSLGSPMASKLGKKGAGREKTSGFELDKWERSDEHPELATDDGKINLIKPDGKSVDNVDYNPYIHIRPTLVNKQFKQAWERPNLVYVRTEYPASELTSGYKADKAKKSVGRHDWNGGELILSRWDKPMEIVPWEEVADDWMKEFGNDGIHFDIIPPKLLPILTARGANIIAPHKGMSKACTEAYNDWKKGSEIRFSVGNHVVNNGKSLVGMHNINADKLRKALKLGGLANPSAAVIDIDKQNHHGYGDISLIMPSAMIGSQGRNGGTYAGDAYTPMYPPVEYRSTKETETRLNELTKGLPKNLAYAIQKRVGDYMDGNTYVSGLEYLFLKEKGQERPIEKNPRRYPNISIEEVAKRLGKEGVKDSGALFEAYEKLEGDDLLNFNIWLNKFGDEAKAQELKDKMNGQNEKAKELLTSSYQKHFPFNRFDTALYQIFGDQRDAGQENVFKTLEDAAIAVDEQNLRTEFEDWKQKVVDNLGYEEVIFTGYTPSGYRKYVPNTIENASREMNKKAQTNWTDGTGIGDTKSMLLDKFTTLAEIRQNKGLLENDSKKIDEAYQKASDDWLHLGMDFRDYTLKDKTAYGLDDNPFIATDNALARLQEAMLKKDPIAYLNKEYKYSLPKDSEFATRLKDVMEEIKNLPSRYFETKFRRPVYMNEFASAVVPKDLPQDLKDALSQNGLKMYEYDPNVEGDRREKTLDATDDDEIRFSIANRNQDIFISNAEKAVEAIKQDKATPEQWLKMIEKNGGLKAGEDKWLGLSEWLKAQSATDAPRSNESIAEWADRNKKKTLTKQEVLDFINQNKIKIEEVKYEDMDDSDAIIESSTPLENEFLDSGANQSAFDKLEEKYPGLSDYYELWRGGRDGNHLVLRDDVSDTDVEKFLDKYGLYRRPINSTRLEYTTRGLDSKREIALTVPNIESWNKSDAIHFGDAGEGRAIAWVRFGETAIEQSKDISGLHDAAAKTQSEFNDFLKKLEDKYGTQPLLGELTKEEYKEYNRLNIAASESISAVDKAQGEPMRILVIDEIQSKRHQEGREKGYKKSRNVLEQIANDAKKELDEFDNLLLNKYSNNDGYYRDFATQEEKAKYNELRHKYIVSEVNIEKNFKAIPDAPFEKNWQELAMKRMLRLAAEEGYDKLAWTTGEQQAARYDLSKEVRAIHWDKQTAKEDGKIYVSVETDYGYPIKGDMTPQEIEAQLGKEIANKIVDGGKYGVLKDEGLKVGGEGMKGFYDKMLLAFMNKYCKQWGVKVEDVTMPNLEEGYQTMHSVDVNSQMKQDVMEGQVMFSISGDENKIEPSSEEDLKKYDAGKMTTSEMVANTLAEFAAKNKENVQNRLDAIGAITKNLKDLALKLRKMSRGTSKLSKRAEQQIKGAAGNIEKATSDYDKSTIDQIVRLSQIMMKGNLFKDFSNYEVRRLLAATKNATGRNDITKQAEKVVDIMLDHALKAASDIFENQMKTQGSKVGNNRVEVQGKLDVAGQRMMKALKEAMKLDADALANRMAEVQDNLGSEDKTVADNAAIEMQALQIAQQYQETIAQSEADEAELRRQVEVAKENGVKGDALKELKESVDEAIMKNKADRLDAYLNLTKKLGGEISDYMNRARAFREKEMQRVRDIQHNANSDLEGISASEHSKASKFADRVNSSVVRFLMKPLATFNDMLQFFGSKSVNGRGYLFNRFMPQWQKALDDSTNNFRRDSDELGAKVSEVMGKKMRWSDLFAMERKMPTIDVQFLDDGKMTDHELTQGQALYIYMVNKMTDGKMKLRAMGITEEDVDRITKEIDPRFIELADWVQDEYLPRKRNDFNAVHERMFGAPMAAIEDYFPLEINSRSRGQVEDISKQDMGDTKPSTTTGSIKKRTTNTLPLDLTNADAFNVLLGHLQDMEHWAAYAEFNRDLNTLLSYKRFKNRVLNMESVRYGAGDTLWKNFKDAAAIAADVYHPMVNRQSLDTAAVNISKGVTSAKIAFRAYTALKQLLSYPAYFGEANIGDLVKNTIHPAKAFNWALDELPGFEQRWRSRQAGDSRLKDTDVDWGFWKNKIVDTARRWGMTPNAFVDGLTVAMGAKAIYETKYRQLKKDGYSDADAKKKALSEASVAYNETQQSSQNAYLSAMQLDRTVASVALTVFRNASMGYERKFLRSLDNLKRKLTMDKQEMIDFMTKQGMREGLTEEQAKKAAERAWNRSWYQDAINTLLFGFVMQFAWNLGSYMAYLLGGDDENEKDAMLEDAAMHAIAGPIEGLTGGSVASDVYNMARSGQKISNYQFNLLPIIGDLQTTTKHLEQDLVRGLNDIVNLVIQAGVGVNPQTITDVVSAIVDATNGDMETGKEIAMLMMRIAQVPQSQLDKLYIDELGLSAADAKKLSAEQLAKRYAEYKVHRDTPLTGWMYSEEGKDKAMNRYEKRFENLIQERIGKMEDEDLERNMESDDAETKNLVGKEIAKRKDSQDKAGSKPSSNWNEDTKKAHETYQRLRNYRDVAEDVLLQNAQKEADEAYEQALKDGDMIKAREYQKRANRIEYIRRNILKKTHSLGRKDGEKDAERMEKIREYRKKKIKELNLQ